MKQTFLYVLDRVARENTEHRIKFEFLINKFFKYIVCNI